MEDLDLRQFGVILKKRWLLIVAVPIFAALISGLMSFFVIKPQYQASTTLLVNQNPENNPALQYQTIMASQALVKTYSNIIKSTTIEQMVIDDLKLPYATTQLNNMINVSSPDQSQVIEVSVTAGNQSEAARIANALANVFQNKAESIMDVQNVQIVDPALVTPNAKPVKPNKKLNVALAFILGLMASIGLAFLLEYLDNRLRTEEDVIKYLNLPVLGAIVEYGDVD